MPDKRKPGGTRSRAEDKTPPAPAPGGFRALGLGAELCASIEKMGWITPTPIQQQAIPMLLEGYDLFGVAQTGTGKTGAFALPIIQMLSTKSPAPPLNPYCIVLAPTRELVQQTGQQFEEFSTGLKIRVITAYGGTSDRPQSTALADGVEVVVGAPGRVIDLMRQGYLQFAQLQFCVLDEADRMFDMGFIDDIKLLLNRMPSRRQTMMFSATLPSQVKKLASDYLYYPREVRIGTVAPPKALSHELWEVRQDDKYEALLKLLEGDCEKVLVFCKTKKRVGDLSKRLAREANESIQAIHADRTQMERDRALALFKGNKLRVLVATDVASRGLDIDDVDLVVNYDVPMDQEDYVHRVGRTARAKKSGLAVTFVSREEERYIAKIERFIKYKISRRSGPSAAEAKPSRQSESKPAKPRRAKQSSRGKGGKGGHKPGGSQRRRGGGGRGGGSSQHSDHGRPTKGQAHSSSSHSEDSSYVD